VDLPNNTLFRVASLPGRSGESGLYVKLLYDALRAHGIDCVTELEPNTTWLKRYSRDLDAIHIHWPERIWRGRHWKYMRHVKNMPGYYRLRKITYWPRCIIGLAYLRSLLKSAKFNNLRIIWTLHDLEPHERGWCLDGFGYRMLANACDLVICHSKSARDAFIKLYGFPNKTLVMRHGNFERVYPKPRSRNNVLQDFGLRPDLPLVSFLGLLRRYKGIELCLKATKKLYGKVQLLIAGGHHASFNINDFARSAANCDEVKFFPRFLSPQEFSDLASVSDAVLLPYHRITTSGILHAAFSLGCGVVASDLPYFREYLHEYPNCGRLFRAGDADAFAKAIEQYLAVPAGVRTEAVKTYMEHHRWDKVIIPLVETIKKWFK